jgi:hypothetical protein
MTTATTLRISASQVGSMLGHNPRQSPLALFHFLRGDMPALEDNEVLQEGRYFEEAIAQIAREKFKLADMGGPREMICDNLIGHPDRYVKVDDKRRAVLEIKNTLFGHEGEGGWGAPGTDEVPPNYWFQGHTYGWLNMMDPYGLAAFPDEPPADHTLLAARLQGGTQLYRIRIDPEVASRVVTEAEAFLARVRENNPPTPRDEADMRLRWLVKEDKVAIAGEAQMIWINRLREMQQAIKTLEKEASEAKMLLLGWAQDAARVVLQDGTVIATLAAQRKFDHDRFVADHPHMAGLFQKLDATALKKSQPALYDLYMRMPENPVEQTRTIRLKDAP